MAEEIYEIPDSLDALFAEVAEEGGMFYRIVNYEKGLDMDNNQSMKHFLENVGICEESIVNNYGTQVILQHPDYKKHVVIDSGGLGDFYSHGFECAWVED